MLTTQTEQKSNLQHVSHHQFYDIDSITQQHIIFLAPEIAKSNSIQLARVHYNKATTS